MQLQLRCSLPLFGSALLALATLACGDDGGGDSEVGDETGTAGDTTATETGAESSDSGTSTSTTDTSTSTTDTSTTDTTDTTTTDTTDTTATDTTDTTATDTTDTTDTGNLGCGELKTEADCLAAAGCQAVNGQPLIGGGLGMQPCLDPAEFLGCIPEQICGDALTWFCLGQDRYLVFDTCGPDGFDPCQGPPNIPMNCP